jgi:hypothetical protein
VVLDDQEAESLGAQCLEMRRDLLGERRVYAGDRLVEQDELGIGHQGAADLEELLLPSRQFSGGIVENTAKVEPFGDCARPAAQRLLAFPRPRGAQQGRDDPFTGLVGAVEQQVLHHRQARKAARDLEGADKPAAGDAVGPPARDIDAIEVDGSGMRGDEAGNAVEQRRLAGAVRSDEAGDALRRKAEIDAVERRDAIEAAAQSGDLEKSHRAPRLGVSPVRSQPYRAGAGRASAASFTG